MKKLKLLIAASCAAAVAAMAGVSSADPVNSPFALSKTFTCDGTPLTLTILQNDADVAFTSSTNVAVAVADTVTQISTGTVVHTFLVPGFKVNGLQTVTCTATFGDFLVSVTAFFIPPTG